MNTGQINRMKITAVNDREIMLESGLSVPRKEVKHPVRTDELLDVFIYYNSDNQLTATTVKPKAQVGELATLKVIELTKAGAFLDWGLPKDLFLPRSYHEDDLQVGDYCLVKIFLDEHTGKILCKETLEDELSNEELSVKEKEVVDLIVYKNTPLGYQVIINGKHLGLIHYNEVFKDLFVGDTLTGFIKKIKPDNKIDVMIGKPGHTRVETESEVILNKLKAQNGFLPFHDKTPSDIIHKEFGMSKKTFKMTVGNLYKQKIVELTAEGIKLLSTGL